MNRMVLTSIGLLVVSAGFIFFFFFGSENSTSLEGIETFQAYETSDEENSTEIETEWEGKTPEEGNAHDDHRRPKNGSGRGDDEIVESLQNGDSGAPPEDESRRTSGNDSQALNQQGESDERVDEEAEMAELSREQVSDGIEAFRPVVRECYKSILDDFPDADGRIILEFTIEAGNDEGWVSMSEIGEDTTLFESELHDCLLYHISEVEFEAPNSGGTVNVTYPFNFAVE